MNNINAALTIIKTQGIRTFVIKLFRKVLKKQTNTTIQDFHDLEYYFLEKDGIEIGGPSGIFKNNGLIPIYDKVKSLDGVNFSEQTIWSGAIDATTGYVIDGKRKGKQYILDAVNLSPIAQNKYDFILSCNNIEHIANPMKAVEQWISVLKKDGILLIVAPKKEANFDHNREIVKFEHLINDYQNNTNENDLTHLEEILVKHDLKLDPPAGTFGQFKLRSLDNINNRCLHHHVFDLHILQNMIEYFSLSLISTNQTGGDYIIVGKK